MNHMHTFHALTAALALAAAAPAQNPYARSGVTIAAVSDPSARQVGDILTVVISEQHSVKNQEKVERRNDTSLAARLEAYSLSDKTFESNVLPKIDIRKESDFNGEAKQNTDSEVRASVAVIVVDVQPNGNLVIAGTRQVTVNDETKTLKISGLVRALDVPDQHRHQRPGRRRPHLDHRRRRQHAPGHARAGRPGVRHADVGGLALLGEPP